MSFFADDFFFTFWPSSPSLPRRRGDHQTRLTTTEWPRSLARTAFHFSSLSVFSFNFSFSFRSFRFYFLFVHFCLFALAIHHHVVGSLTASRHTFIHFGWLCSMFSLYPHLGATKSVAIRTQKRRNHLNFQSKFQSLFHAIVTYLTHNLSAYLAKYATRYLN